MTMQRIDENTYIDDSLVTCAEYQLFIDEMREQGKYYQPDHWTSYQFPKGQAKEPILGVRHADAVAFCEWLIQQDEGEWKFRLPGQEDADRFPINPAGNGPLGYWLVEQYQFAWVRYVPEGAIDLDLASDLALARALNRALDIDRSIASTHDCDIALALTNTLALTSARDLAVVSTRELDLARALAGARDLDLAIDIYIELVLLNERIAGRFPAFEGIRLVKERMP